MRDSDKAEFSRYLRVLPLRVCSRGLAPSRRARYFWASWKVPPAEGVEVHELDGHISVTLTATRPDPVLWTDAGWEWLGSPETSLPTFIRSAPKKKPGYLPAGLAHTPEDARRRWRADRFRFPPYQYKREFCFRSIRERRRLRVVSVEEREILMFLGRGFTSHCWNPTKAKADPAGFNDARLSLVGNAFNAGVVAALLAPLFQAEGYLERRPSPNDLVQRMGLRPGEVFYDGLDCCLGAALVAARHDTQPRGVVAPSAAAANAAVSANSTVELEKKLFHSLVRSADYRGSDVRLDSGELYRPASWPRRSIDPAKWVWYNLVAHEIKRSGHISILEVKSALLALRWRTRSAKRIFTRFFHLLDSQVALAVLVKGRSSSEALNRVVKRASALTLAASLMPAYGYVRSDWNPADGASRFWEKRRKRSSFPRRRRAKVVKSPTPKGVTRRNTAFPRDFDSSLGYPGEGPARKGKRAKPRAEKRRTAKVIKGAERFVSKRTQLERYLARRGFKLRDAAMTEGTKRLYQRAFTAFWTWAGVAPPLYVESIRAYDTVLAEYIARSWECGATRGEVATAAHLHSYDFSFLMYLLFLSCLSCCLY